MRSTSWPAAAVATILALLLSGCFLLPGGPGRGGVEVRGSVTAGPTCPVVTNPPDPACAERPVPGAVLVVTTTAGEEVARATSGADGTFRLALDPGSYRLVAQPVDGLMGTPAPLDLEVVGGEPINDLQVSYDTGIR
jgi:Carboxypeptidase regulatory-like domain